MSRKRKAPIRKVYPDPKFRSEIVSDLNFGSAYTFLIGAFRFLDINYFGFFAPYNDLLCFLLATPCVSRFPLKM